ncbi:hypothetical protein K503DRAFT_778026 [Rhizopogon vinicolor AM-OR11-026]|uniref:Uncharacterized protein n=1 Tax=Rhizopogon vinicolor AM-OR11-026 TaxID=1314800 RepID=A0A1B7ME01_9AGAM|nr:hypothetical protein K503DRAFT_778026 [Rhizopogon vinicolor AM-OR11-026]
MPLVDSATNVATCCSEVRLPAKLFGDWGWCGPCGTCTSDTSITGVGAAIIDVFARFAYFRTGTDRHSCCQSNNNGEEGETHYLY